MCCFTVSFGLYAWHQYQRLQSLIVDQATEPSHNELAIIAPWLFCQKRYTHEQQAVEMSTTIKN